MAKLILTTVIFIFSIILSGLAILIDLHQMTGISFSLWLIIFGVLCYSYYKYKFKKISFFRMFIFREYLKVNNFFQKIDKSVTYESKDQKVNPIEEKAIKLWKIYLKDKDSYLSCSISKGTRQIEKDNLLLLLSPQEYDDYLMTIIEAEYDKSHLYEVVISRRNTSVVMSSFDNENEKRMKGSEDDKRNSIHTELDSLLEIAMNKKPQKV